MGDPCRLLRRRRAHLGPDPVWASLLLIVAAVVLPYSAVLFANAGRERRRLRRRAHLAARARSVRGAGRARAGCGPAPTDDPDPGRRVSLLGPTPDAVDELICSARGCRADATWGVLWNNPSCTRRSAARCGSRATTTASTSAVPRRARLPAERRCPWRTLESASPAMSPAARRATGLVLVGLVLAVTCTFLGRWQWNRHVWRDGAIAVVEANWSADPVPLGTVLDSPGTALTDATSGGGSPWSGTTSPTAPCCCATGRWTVHPAYHVLVPFVVEDADGSRAVRERARRRPRLGGARRGRERRRRPARAPRRARSRSPRGCGTTSRPSNRTAPAGQVQAISVDQVLDGRAGVAGPTFDAYGAHDRGGRRPSPRSPGRCPRRAPTRARTCPTRSSGGRSRSAGSSRSAWARAASCRTSGAAREGEPADAGAGPGDRPRSGVELWPTRDTPDRAAHRRHRTSPTAAAGATRTPRTR